MSDSDQRWKELPIFRELFLQWRKARAKAEPRARAFSRDWERLLQDAQLTSAELRREADRDARTLEAAGLVAIRTERLRPYQIQSVSIPLEAEPRIRILFADELPDASEEAIDLSKINWSQKLRFLCDSRTAIPFEDLDLLNRYLLSSSPNSASVPIKERSLEVFGDEKRLDALLLTNLFRADRLTLEDLRCHIVPEPLAWKRGHQPGGPLIVIENAATWDSYCHWDAKRHCFGAIVYGCGNRFRDGISFLGEIFRELGGPAPVYYFGDLDPQGTRIPVQASLVARSIGLPEVLPHLWSYRALLACGKPQPNPSTDLPPDDDLAWFGEIAPQVSALLRSWHRLAQEAIGADFLARNP